MEDGFYIEERDEYDLHVLVNGRPMCSTNKVFSVHCQFEGDIKERVVPPVRDAKCKEIESAWQLASRQTIAAVYHAVGTLSSLHDSLGVHSLSIEYMVEGKPCEITITLNKKNAD